MERIRTELVTFWIAGSVLAFSAVPASAQGASRRAPSSQADVPARNDLRAELVAPVGKVSFGAPIDLELTLSSPAPWTGYLRPAQWEFEVEASGEWVAFEDKSASDAIDLHVPSEEPIGIRYAVPAHMVAKLSPGRWRVRFELSDSRSSTSTAWCHVEVAAHEVNRRILMGEQGMNLQRAWERAVEASCVGEFAPTPTGAWNGRVDGEALESVADALRDLRAVGASRELADRGESLSIQREIRRLPRLVDAEKRADAARELDQRLEGLVAASEVMSSPLGGQRGRLLEIRVELWSEVDPERALQIVEEVRSERPQLAARMK